MILENTRQRVKLFTIMWQQLVIYQENAHKVNQTKNKFERNKLKMHSLHIEEMQ